MRGLLAWICFLDFLTMYYNLFYTISMMMPIYTRPSSALDETITSANSDDLLAKKV